MIRSTTEKISAHEEQEPIWISKNTNWAHNKKAY